jgi:hypothetical protein
LDVAVAQTFPHWHNFAVSAVPRPADDATGRSDIFVCKRCRMPVVGAKEIMSSNYHNACGKAYLVSSVIHVDFYGSREDVMYTTGNYTVQHVRCRSGACQQDLGVAYLAADDPENAYKVGTFMIGQSLVERPPCCAGRASLSLSEMCAGCAHRGAVRSCGLVSAMTNKLEPRLTRRLLAILEEEQSQRAVKLPKLVEQRMQMMPFSPRDQRFQSFQEMVCSAISIRSRTQVDVDEAPPHLPFGKSMLRKLSLHVGQMVGRSRAFANTVKMRVGFLHRFVGDRLNSVPRFLGSRPI